MSRVECLVFSEVMHNFFRRTIRDAGFSRVPTYHGPPKPTFLEGFCWKKNLVFRWPKPLFFMVGRGLMVYYTLHLEIVWPMVYFICNSNGAGKHLRLGKLTR